MCLAFTARYVFIESFSFLRRRAPGPTLFPYTTLFRSPVRPSAVVVQPDPRGLGDAVTCARAAVGTDTIAVLRSEEHTSELQSHSDLVCRLLLEKKNTVALQYSCTYGPRQSIFHPYTGV